MADKFSDIKSHAQALRSNYGNRDNQYKVYEDLYLMKGDSLDISPDAARNLNIMLSPDARNAVLGALRIMIAGEPTFSVDGGDIVTPRDTIEKAVNTIFQLSGKIKRKPVHFDALLSGLLYGEIHMAVTPMKELAGRMQGKSRARAERLAKLCPVLIEVWNPRNGYPEFDRLGLCAYYRVSKVTRAELESSFAEYYPEDLRGKGSPMDTIELHTFYDMDNAYFWINDRLLYSGEHGYPEIPISVTAIDGSELFERPEDRNQPLLYTMARGKIWTQQTMALTTLYTLVFGMGAAPLVKHTAPPTNPQKKIEDTLDFTNVISSIELEPGENVDFVMQRGLVDPIFHEALRLSRSLGEESTIYKQTFGQPLGREATFSEMALLHQSGRLPLSAPQKVGGRALADVMELALRMMKSDNIHFRYGDVDLKASDIPDDISLKCAVEVKLPQDRLQMANIAVMLIKSGLASREWIQENILNIQDTSGERERVWTDAAAEAKFQAYLQRMMQDEMMQQAAQQQVRQSMMPAQEPVVPPGGGMPATAHPPQAGEMEGFPPVMGGLPPEQGGMMPGAGQAAMPGVTEIPPMPS